MNVPVSQASHSLNTLPFDPELTPGARNAVGVCLRIQPSEKVTDIILLPFEVPLKLWQNPISL